MLDRLIRRADRPLLTLHSGACGTEPNSREFFRTAAAVRPDLVEMDLRVAADGTIVVHHDSCLSCGGTLLPIREHSFKELREAAPCLLTLHEAMVSCRKRGLCMNWDMKNDETLEALLDELGPRDGPWDFLLSGCHPEQLRRVRARNPSVPLLLNAEGEELQQEGDCGSAYCAALMDEAERAGCCGLNMNQQDCRPGIAALARSRGMPLWIWTVNEEAVLRTLWARGVRSMTTDRPDLFRKVQAEWGGTQEGTERSNPEN